MTDQPPAPSSGDSPQGSSRPTPQPGWAPAPLSDGGRPSVGAHQPVPASQPAPLGGPALRSVKIDEFAPPRSRLPLVVTLVVLLVAGLIWGTTMLRPGAASTEPSATPRPSATATQTGPGKPFLSPDERYSGRWEIVDHRWTDSGLEVEIRVAVDRGPLNYSFLAFENSGVDVTKPSTSSQVPQFSGAPIQTGQQESGWMFFPLDRGPATIILATGTGSQMSALAVAG